MTNTRSTNEHSAHVRQTCMQDPLRPKAAPPALHAAPPSVLLTLRGTVGSGTYLEIMRKCRPGRRQPLPVLYNILRASLPTQAPWLKHAPRKACPTKAVYVPRPGLVIMPKEVFVSKGSTNFLKNLCRLHLLQCLVNEVLRLKG